MTERERERERERSILISFEEMGITMPEARATLRFFKFSESANSLFCLGRFGLLHLKPKNPEE